MKWFRHDSNASNDAKLRKLVLRHSGDGYAIYFHCLELVASSIEKNKDLTFEIEHDSEIIASNLNIKSEAGLSAIDKVNRIMNYIVELGLFESSGDVITCLKLAKRVDNSIVKNPQLKAIQQQIREKGLIPDNPRQSETITARLDKTRLEENRIDKISNKDEPNGSEAIYLNNSDITKPLIISSSDAPNLCLSCVYEELPNFEGSVIMGCKSAMPFKNRKMFWRDSTYPIKCEAFKLKVNSKPEAREQAVNQTTVKQNKGATSNQQAIEPFLNHNCQAKSKPSQEKKPVRLKKFDEAEINLFKQFSEKFLAKTGMKYHSAKYFADLTNCKSILKRAENSKIDLDSVIDYLLSDKVFHGYNKNIQTLNKHLENFAIEMVKSRGKDDGSLSSRQAGQSREEAQADLDRMEAHQKMIRENKKGGQNE